MTAKQTKRLREPEPPVTDGFTVLHRARMLNWSVSGVTCIAACPDGSVFAAGYEDGKVEIFDAVVYNRLAVSFLSVTLPLCVGMWAITQSAESQQTSKVIHRAHTSCPTDVIPTAARSCTG